MVDIMSQYVEFNTSAQKGVPIVNITIIEKLRKCSLIRGRSAKWDAISFYGVVSEPDADGLTDADLSYEIAF